MSKKNTAKKALELEAPVATQPETVTETPKAEIKAMPKRVVRGHKYDGRELDLAKLTDKLEIGSNSPKPPRGAGRPSVMYRIYALVAEKPGVQINDLITEIQDRSAEFSNHPSEYARKERLEALWVRDYIKGALIAGHLKVAE